MKRATILAAITFPLLAGLAAAQPADADARTWKIYDLRDLIGLLPPAEQPPPYTGAENLMLSTGSPLPDYKPQPAPNPVDTLLGRLCDAFGAPHERLLDGVYGVEATDEAHDLLRRMLLEVRALHAERYVVEIAWYTLTDGERPAVGKSGTPPASATLQSLVVTRRTPTVFSQVVRRRFLAGVNPVVAEGAVAYEPEPGIVLDGIRATVCVGASPDAEGTTTLRLLGDVYLATLGRLPARPDSGMEPSPAIEFPAEAVRTLRADVPIAFAQWTTLAVVPGFVDGATIVVFGRVSPLAGD